MKCDNIGCNNEPKYKITTLDHKFIFTCLKHHDSIITDNKENIFNIIVLEE